LQQQQQGLTIVDACGLACHTAEPLNSSSLPWFKNVDLRVTKGVKIRGLDWTLFAEAKNLFNFQNLVNAFLETGTNSNGPYQQQFLIEQKGLLAGEAKAAGILGADSSVNFNQLGGCNNWAGRNSGPG